MAQYNIVLFFYYKTDMLSVKKAILSDGFLK